MGNSCEGGQNDPENLVNKEFQTDLEPGRKSTPDFRKRPRKPTISLQETSIKKPAEKGRKPLSNQKSGWNSLLERIRKEKKDQTGDKNGAAKTVPLRGGVDKALGEGQLRGDLEKSQESRKSQGTGGSRSVVSRRPDRRTC